MHDECVTKFLKLVIAEIHTAQKRRKRGVLKQWEIRLLQGAKKALVSREQLALRLGGHHDRSTHREAEVFAPEVFVGVSE